MFRQSLLSSKKRASSPLWPTRISKLPLCSASATSIPYVRHMSAEDLANAAEQAAIEKQLPDKLFDICNPGECFYAEGVILESKQEDRKLHCSASETPTPFVRRMSAEDLAKAREQAAIEKQLSDKLQAAIEKQLSDKLFGICNPGECSYAEGVILESKQEDRKLWALDPFSRSNCRELTQDFVEGKRNRDSDAFPGRPIMMTAAAKDQGQSIQQYYNLVDFVDLTKGIAIETSFNHDQKDLWSEICDDERGMDKTGISRTLAYRIIHRLVEHHKGSAVAHELFGKVCDPETLNLIRQLKSPVLFALQITRKMLGFAEDTKVLVVVDEPNHILRNDKSIYSVMHNIGYIISCDKAAFTSVTSLSCADLFWLRGDYKGRDYMQPLHPNLFYIDDANVPLLPSLLQQFFLADKKKLLRYSDGDKVQYARLAKLVLEAGAHPKTLSVLLEQLRLFPDHTGSKKKFSKALGIFLDENIERIRAAMAQAHSDEINVDLDRLAKDCAESFANQYTYHHRIDTGGPYHGPFCDANREGNCQYIPSHPVHCVSGNAYLPLSVLKHINNSHPTASGFFLNDLMHLYKKLDLFVDQKLSGSDKTGNAWHGVVAASLLMFSRCNPQFKPSVLALHLAEQYELYMWQDISAGSSVQYWDDVGNITRGSANSRKTFVSQFSSILRRLRDTPDCEGAVFVSNTSRKGGGDVYGLFRQYNRFVLLVMDCRDSGRRHKPNDKIDTGRRIVRKNAREIFIDGVSVRRLFFLCSPDDLNAPRQHAVDQGVVTLNTMRGWLPTAAYACQAACRLGAVFAPDRRMPADRNATADK